MKTTLIRSRYQHGNVSQTVTVKWQTYLDNPRHKISNRAYVMNLSFHVGQLFQLLVQLEVSSLKSYSKFAKHDSIKYSKVVI